ncbi:MAG: DnaJ domain-containing protein [Micrococcales bacterium]|nr:DnaJ domain-containing protein [Micrococcales bacterium]MCL2666202.1 DnaJ domain-containing protein [Micrococcales bacterium]
MTGQDWLSKDFYAMLGVPKDADAATIKKAYRKKARTLHPDQNPGDARAEEQFKDIGEAYAVLSDPEQRERYDELRALGGGARFTAGGPGAAGFDDLLGGMFGPGSRVRFSTGAGPAGGPGAFDDLLGGIFGGRAPSRRGTDLNASTSLPFRTAASGSTVSLSVEGRTVNARVPAGVRDGQKIRLRGKGRPGDPPGDLVIEVRVEPHPVFATDGDNLRVTVPVSFDEAALGAQVAVPTLDGTTVKVKVPAGTPSGRTLRVKGKGLTSAKGAGDLMVTVQVAVPRKLTGAARDAVAAFAEATSGDDPRAELYAAARQ